MRSDIKISTLSKWSQNKLLILIERFKQLAVLCIELFKEARDSRYFQSLREIDWDKSAEADSYCIDTHKYNRTFIATLH